LRQQHWAQTALLQLLVRFQLPLQSQVLLLLCQS
jgi:hypothetical protein